MMYAGKWAVVTILVLSTTLLAVVGLTQNAPNGQGSVSGENSDSALAGPKQPLPFSHKTHAAAAVNCGFCHDSNSPDEPIALPSTAVCMNCHATIDKDKPAIQDLSSFARENRSIPWVRVYSVPGWVYWSHAPHLKAGLQCAECHGDVAKMDVMQQTKNVTTMDGCSNCHQLHNVANDCGSCHEADSP